MSVWRYPLVRWGMKAYGAFPIERGNGDLLGGQVLPQARDAANCLEPVLSSCR
jgi:1-acyl-sn-glycerol-3-phosphate acyltransferase